MKYNQALPAPKPQTDTTPWGLGMMSDPDNDHVMHLVPPPRVLSWLYVVYFAATRH